MAQYQRKSIPFLHRGLNWNLPIEKLPDGQVSWGKNIRVLEQGTVSTAHGYTLLFTIGAPAVNYIHTMSRMNILNPAFSSTLVPTYVVGGDTSLYVFQNVNQFLHPTPTPYQQVPGNPGPSTNCFSGNPLSVIDAQPAGAAVAWKYIGDSLQMVTVGYYPGDTDASTARCLTMGLDPPTFAAWAYDVVIEKPSSGTGMLNSGTPAAGSTTFSGYQWAFAYRRVQTGARSNPSAATRFSLPQPGYTAVNEQAILALPACPLDPQTGQPDTNVVVDVYRFGGLILRWALVGSGPGGSTFIDNTPDESLLAAPAPPQITDATTGLTRFNLYRPFVTQDIARTGTVSMGQGPVREGLANSYYIVPLDGNNFNLRWLPGSTIYINGVACSIYQINDVTHLEIAEDLTGPLSSGAIPPLGTPVTWSINAGTLTAGQPLPHIWGPYGIGQSGAYVFACGDPNALGTLYWTNGNDPDSTDIVNNIIVTSPSERLMTGCIYTGQPYCWSTERQFSIFPSLTVFGQFTTQEVPGAKGCWLEWSLSVQSNGLSDQSVSWRGKDGIYDMSPNGLTRLTDPLYSFFPHDNDPGIAPETILPYIGYNSAYPEYVGNLDDTQPQYHRLCWFQGLLFYDFVAQSQQPGYPDGVSTFSTLVWDTVNIPNGGWVSLDQPFGNTLQPVARGIQIGANLPVDAETEGVGVGGTIYGPLMRGGSLLVSWGNFIYDYYGLQRGFKSRFITRAEDAGDSRAMKVWGDYWLDCTPLNDFTVFPLVNFHSVTLQGVSVPKLTVIDVPPAPPSIVIPDLPPVRNQFTLDFQEFTNAGGNGLLTPTLGLDIQWNGANGQFAASLYQWQPSFVAKPEYITFRATDRDDQGQVQAKYLMGCNIEADTRPPLTAGNLMPPAVTVPVNVIVDGNLVTTLELTHNGQLEVPYAWEPVAGYEFQVQFQFDPLMFGTLFQIYKVNWIWQVWPDAIARKYPFMNLGTSGDKYIKGIVMPMETGGQPGGVGVWGDDADTLYNWTKTTENLKKTGEVLDLPAPFTAHELQFFTTTNCRIWPDEVKVDFDPWPESSTDVSSFSDLGYPGAKFMQGMVVPMETGGQSVTFDVNSDCGQSVTMGPVSTPTDCKNDFAFSFGPCNQDPSDPFIAHQVQIVPNSNVRIWYNEIKWIWEPEPELVSTWCTQPTDHDMPTWHHLRDCFIAYRGGQGAPTLYITTEYGTLAYPLDYVGPNVYTRCYRVLQPQKAKWRSYRVEGCGLFRLYIKDCSVRVKEWGNTGPYISAQPFGDFSRTNGGARI